MGKVAVLDDVTVSKIAAGEVVERPASVVKELVENSFDAGATRVDVLMEAGGRRLIRVTDNGCGMAPDDAVLAFSRHATSKIRRIEDIRDVRTMGFRGEALASIAAVARVELRTQTPESTAGTVVRVEAGRLLSVVDGAATPGTTIEVRDLFFNVPARLKFLKSDDAESARVFDVIYGLAIANPAVSLSLTANGKPAVRTQGTGVLLDVIASLYGTRLAEGLVALEATPSGDCPGPNRPDGEGVQVAGYVGDPAVARGSRAIQYLFVNSRLVRSPSLRAAIEEAYSGFILGRRYPIFFVNVMVPPAWVDVNVHPQKAEVRISREVEVKRRLYAAVRAAVSRRAGAGPAEPGRAVAGGFEGELPLSGREAAAIYAPASRPPVNQIPLDGTVAAPYTGSSIGPFAGFRVVGQVLDSYIVAEGPRGLHIIDQHAAHERVWYERYLNRQGLPATQPLAVPEVVDMAPGDYEASIDVLDSLRETGFDVEPFGNNTLLLKGIPAGFEPANARALLMSVAQASSSAPRGRGAVETAARALAACHSAVRAGRSLSNLEAAQLLYDLGATSDPFRCPHGRPTVIDLEVDELERRFGRRFGTATPPLTALENT